MTNPLFSQYCYALQDVQYKRTPIHSFTGLHVRLHKVTHRFIIVDNLGPSLIRPQVDMMKTLQKVQTPISFIFRLYFFQQPGERQKEMLVKGKRFEVNGQLVD